MKSIYKMGNKIFVGLDTCANVHSVPYMPLLTDPRPADRSIGTSGGETSARLYGNFTFMVDIPYYNTQKRVNVSNALGMPDSGLPLLSVNLLKRSGAKHSNGYIGFHGDDSWVKIECVNGLYGIWVTPIIPENHLSTNVTDQLHDAQPPERFVGQPRIESIDFPPKIANEYWSEYNENRGEFTHQVFTTRSRSNTPEQWLNDWYDCMFCSYAFLVTPPSNRSNEFYVQLFEKIDHDFSKNPHDTKILIIIQKAPRSSWWKYLCNYEIIDEVVAESLFYIDKDGKHIKNGRDLIVLYRDINTVTKINPLILLHLRLMHFSNVYILDLLKKNVDLGLTINETFLKMAVDYFCKGCQVRHRKLPVKASHQDFSQYHPFQYVCMDGTGPLPVESLHGNFYIWGVMCMSTRWVRVFFTRNKDQAEVFVVFNRFLEFVQTNSRFDIENLFVTERLLTDLGGEFLNKSMISLCVKRRIAHKFSAATMHHQNAHIERYFQTLWTE